MTAQEAVERAVTLRDEVAKQSKTGNETIIAALVVAAALYQTLDWIEEKLERVIQYMPSDT